MVQTKIHPTSILKTNTKLSYEVAEAQHKYMLECVAVYLRSRGYEFHKATLCIGDQWATKYEGKYTDVRDEDNKVCFNIMKNRYKKPLEKIRRNK